MSETEKPEESGGPYTCCRCTASTWNDDDWCDECRAESADDSSILSQSQEGEKA